MHPALGDSGGVHAAALLLLKLRGALARLLPALWSGAPAAPEGSRLLIGQGRLLCADVLSPLVSTSLAIRAIHVVALLARAGQAYQDCAFLEFDWIGISIWVALPIAKGERDTFTAFTIRKRTYFSLSLKSPDLCEVCDHAIL